MLGDYIDQEKETGTSYIMAATGKTLSERNQKSISFHFEA